MELKFQKLRVCRMVEKGLYSWIKDTRPHTICLVSPTLCEWLSVRIQPDIFQHASSFSEFSLPFICNTDEEFGVNCSHAKLITEQSASIEKQTDPSFSASSFSFDYKRIWHAIKAVNYFMMLIVLYSEINSWGFCLLCQTV